MIDNCYEVNYGIWYYLPCEYTNARQYAKSQVKPDEWICLDELWDRESSWKTNSRAHLSVNRSSGAYGIPQALPATKMQSAGSNWRYNYQIQIDWGIAYIKERYGNACAALKHHDRKKWY